MLTTNILLTEVLFAIIYIIAFFILREFVNAKDGQLRIIMIVYFSIEILMYLGSAIYFYLIHIGKSPISIDTFRLMILLPKVGVKLWLLYYLKFGRVSKRLVNDAP